MPMDNVTLENTQQSISSRDAKSVASVMVNGKWVNLSDTLEQANVKSDVGTVAKQVAAQQEVVSNAVSVADSAVAYANDAIEKSRVNSQAIDDINSAVSDAKTAFNSDVAEAKNLANAAQTTADSAIKSASSVANDLTAVASQAKSNADGITKVTSDVGLLQTTVADNSGNISTIQETAKQIQQAVSDNAGNITVAKQTADSAVAVASDAKSNATVAVQTASQASITASNASGQAASAVLTANGAMTTASNANSYATVAVQTANGASLTATNATNDATVAKQTASEAKIQASNAESDFAQISIRAGQIEASVANNSGAIASVQQTANGLTTTVGNVDNRVKKIEDNTNWTTKTGALDMNTLTTTQNIYYRDTNLKNADGETGWAYIQVVSTGERVTQTVWHDRSSIQHTRTGALNGSNYNWDAWNKVATNAQVVEVKETVDGIQAQVYNSDGSSKITQLSDLVQNKVSSGDFTSMTTQLKDLINQRVQVGDVISQINQEAGGDTLIQVSNGKKSLILDAGNTIITGKAWIPSAAIANLTADQVQAGTLTGSTVHLGDSNGNTIDLGVLDTNHVGFHSKATNGDQTYIDNNGIHNYGATYDTKISQGQITTNLLSVNGGGLIDFRSGGSGATLSEQEFQFYNSNSVNGGLSFSGSVPIAPAADGAGGNELRIRYDRSFAVTPISDDSARICASPAVLELGFVQSGSSTPDLNNTGLWVDRNNRYMNLGVWETDSTWTRIAAGSHNIQMQANDAHAWLYNNNFHIYRDNDGGSATATELQVDGWAWVRGWVEAAGHSQHSALSTKTALQAIDDDEMLEMVNNTDLASFLFKTDVASGETHRHIGVIIDDVHDVAQYQIPQEFIAPNGVSRDDDNMIGALFGAVKALTKRIKTLESKVG